MSDLISKKALIKAILAEREKYPLEIEERYSFGVKVPCKFNQALRGGIRKCLHIIETMPTVDVAELTNGDKIRAMSDKELAELGVYITKTPDYDEDIDGEWVICGTITDYVSIFNGDISGDAEDAIDRNLSWLKRKAAE